MSEVFELRQYTLHPGRRDTLIELFERQFLETQEDCGMRVVGQFRDLGDPDRFVWFRSFPDMARRKEALECFYGGPVWKAHRDLANATLIDSDDVLLLRLVDAEHAFPPPAERPPAGTPERPSSRFALTVYSFSAPIGDAVLELVRRELPARILLQTEPAANNYPALPVRTGEHVIVALTSDMDGNVDPPPAVAILLASAPKRMTLEPGARSMLR